MLIVFVDGIGTHRLKEGDGRSILEPVATRIAAAVDGRVHRIRWPASMAGIGGRLTWRQASAQAVEALDHLVDRHPGEDLVLLAYSGGCLPLHDWLDQRPQHHHRIKAVGFMSDPFRPRDRWQHDTREPHGYGVCGARRGPIAHKTYWTTVAGDVISDALRDALLRTVADLSDRIPGGFLDDLWNHHLSGSWQLAWQLHVIRTNPLGWLLGLGPRLDQARRDIHGYMTGRHTSAYHELYITRRPDGGEDERPLADRLADTIAWAVNNAKET